MKQILLLNGPNLNLLGSREPEIYGHETLSDIENKAAALAKTLGLGLSTFQSNREYELIEAIHKAKTDGVSGIIINPGAFGHTSIALLDALNFYEGAVIEVHISNIYKREEFRHQSYIAKRADGIIAGCGVQGYELALTHIAKLVG